MDGGCAGDRRRMRDGRPSATRLAGCVTDALRSSVHRASVALPSQPRRAAAESAAHPLRVRRLSCAQPPSIRHNAEISVVKMSSHRRRVIAIWSSLCPGCRRVHFAQSSHNRRMLVAPSSHRRRTVVASLLHRRHVVAVSSSHRRRTVVASSQCRRRNVVVLSLSWPSRPLLLY